MKKFEKIFFSMIAMIMMAAVGTVFTSCANDDDVILTIPIEKVDEADARHKVQTRSLSSFPVQVYAIAQKYKNAFRHINQYDDNPSETQNCWPGGTSNPGNCSWSNYVMAVGCVGRASGTISSSDYRMDKARRLKTFMKQKRTTYMNGSVMEYIYKDYGLVHDEGQNVGLRHWKTSKYSSNHAIITEEILTHLRDVKTPVVIIGTKNGYGHYFTIVSIVWNGTIDNSEIWVVDSTVGQTDTNFENSKKESYGKGIYGMGLRTFLNNVSKGKDSDYHYCNVLFIYDLNP